MDFTIAVHEPGHAQAQAASRVAADIRQRGDGLLSELRPRRPRFRRRGPAGTVHSWQKAGFDIAGRLPAAFLRPRHGPCRCTGHVPRPDKRD
ncbi:hypothetical protein [Paracoccus sp. pheM1]|uniref:hypothetical protein n=1 Tax=Paracoccus sp. pheM1 TaxID=2831675 RepID=UPI001F0A3B7B|nr:hypothetical protein [Paracoccus sp. pheM1]